MDEFYAYKHDMKYGFAGGYGPRKFECASCMDTGYDLALVGCSWTYGCPWCNRTPKDIAVARIYPIEREPDLGTAA